MTAYVRQLHKTVWRKNPASGHEWPEHIPIQKFEVGGVGGGYGNGPFYRTEKAAQEQVDYLNRFVADRCLDAQS